MGGRKGGSAEFSPVGESESKIRRLKPGCFQKAWSSEQGAGRSLPWCPKSKATSGVSKEGRRERKSVIGIDVWEGGGSATRYPARWGLPAPQPRPWKGGAFPGQDLQEGSALRPLGFSGALPSLPGQTQRAGAQLGFRCQDDQPRLYPSMTHGRCPAELGTEKSTL